MPEEKSVPNTFVKTFVYDYAEDIDDKVNTFAEDNELEIRSISVVLIVSAIVATVVFERGCER